MNGKKIMATLILILLLFNLTGCINHELTDEDLIGNLIDTWAEGFKEKNLDKYMGVYSCLLYTSPSPRDRTRSRMPSSA